MITNNFTALCIHPTYAKSYKIIDAEANDWTKADRYCRDLMKDEFSPGLVFADSADKSGMGRYGIYTDEAEKLKWAMEIERAFMSGAVCYARDFISVGGAEEFKRGFEDEVRFFRVERKPPEDIWSKDKFIVTGKGNGGKCDDRICAFGFSLAQTTRRRGDRRWNHWAGEHGVRVC
jgi:hypothetical protein